MPKLSSNNRRFRFSQLERLESRYLLAISAPTIDSVGVFRAGDNYYDVGQPGYQGERPVQFGLKRDRAVAGDWDGDGVDQVGVFRNGWWFLDTGAPGYQGERPFQFGLSTDQIVAGDWDGDGDDEVGVFRNGWWYLDTGRWGYQGERPFAFGLRGDRAVAGDFDGDGKDEVGVYRRGWWFLDVGLRGYQGERPFHFGTRTDEAIAGDWDGDGVDEVGVYRSGWWYLDVGPQGYQGEKPFHFGGFRGDQPYTGTWRAPSGQLARTRDFEPVDFVFDRSRLEDISVNGQSILGPNVQTGGGYLIGSVDGSDNSGQSVDSIGAFGGVLTSQTGSNLPQVPFSMTFTEPAPNRLRFTINVGPVPANFNTLSLPFDFDQNVVRRFSFGGRGFASDPCSGTGRLGNVSSANFDSVRQVCTIPDTNGGRVGVAVTRGPVSWGEVAGSFGSLRLNILNSNHFRNMRFHNHFGTHNMELSFGSFRRGESASVTGEIIVTPSTGVGNPIGTFSAENLRHQVGRRESGAFAANTRQDAAGYLTYGPYTTRFGAGRHRATFRLLVDNNKADDLPVATIDVTQVVNGRVEIIAIREITRKDFKRAWQYQDFALDFDSIGNGTPLEFRVYFHDTSYLRQDWVKVGRI